MKQTKILLSTLIILSSVLAASAQNTYDAINMCNTQHFGSARSMAVGNAVTAIGGDLGTIGINPAGSAVANYGQLVITPGLSISAVGARYNPYGDQFGSESRVSQGRVNLPNMGISMIIETGNKTGVKSISLAVVSSQTAQYNQYVQSIGINPFSSKMAEAAAAATGIPEDILKHNSSYGGNVPWDVLAAYQGGMFGSYGTDGLYAAVSEAIPTDGSAPYVSGDLSQTALIYKRGSNNDVIINSGLNISDKLFVGFNLSFPVAEYHRYETFTETALRVNDFPISYADGETYFSSGSFETSYNYDLEGVGAKLGFIATPIKGLRLGAAIQSPYYYTVSEQWRNSAKTVFASSHFNQSAYSPDGKNDYALVSPYSANFGLAYTFGQWGFLSVDYQLTDYSIMRFVDISKGPYNDVNNFISVNESNRRFAGVSHNFRIGAELKLSPSFALRAGYGVVTSPERYWTNNLGEEVNADVYIAEFDSYFNNIKTLRNPQYYGDKTQTISGGIGYSSKGSFFADFALVCTKLPDTIYRPYPEYECVDKKGSVLEISSPQVLIASKLWQAAITIGWRF